MVRRSATSQLNESSAQHAEERLLLWAVAGLRGVVIGGRLGSRSVPQPRAVLWGQHSGSLIRHPQACLKPIILIWIQSPNVC